ncbi:hypothetical protein TRFO_24830 [Tritrichomonas foetus]|uniref:Uncharacterized protein n=1 Tax=Tritrichomonas foetus TaxID=1144522 RepID=A0A1J4KBE8_9EUKA|nr:hypothetical protein TRFO_24830 [Tritrichomonas foetus]|eukprot:OHT07014.1 hypothetical protein TRFO_24830 [Tritrichomonas foetus]
MDPEVARQRMERRKKRAQEANRRIIENQNFEQKYNDQNISHMVNKSNVDKNDLAQNEESQISLNESLPTNESSRTNEFANEKLNKNNNIEIRTITDDKKLIKEDYIPNSSENSKIDNNDHHNIYKDNKNEIHNNNQINNCKTLNQPNNNDTVKNNDIVKNNDVVKNNESENKFDLSQILNDGFNFTKIKPLIPEYVPPEKTEFFTFDKILYLLAFFFGFFPINYGFQLIVIIGIVISVTRHDDLVDKVNENPLSLIPVILDEVKNLTFRSYMFRAIIIVTRIVFCFIQSQFD